MGVSVLKDGVFTVRNATELSDATDTINNLGSGILLFAFNPTAPIVLPNIVNPIIIGAQNQVAAANAAALFQVQANNQVVQIIGMNADQQGAGPVVDNNSNNVEWILEDVDWENTGTGNIFDDSAATSEGGFTPSYVNIEGIVNFTYGGTSNIATDNGDPERFKWKVNGECNIFYTGGTAQSYTASGAKGDFCCTGKMTVSSAANYTLTNIVGTGELDLFTTDDAVTFQLDSSELTKIFAQPGYDLTATPPSTIAVVADTYTFRGVNAGNLEIRVDTNETGATVINVEEDPTTADFSQFACVLEGITKNSGATTNNFSNVKIGDLVQDYTLSGAGTTWTDNFNSGDGYIDDWLAIGDGDDIIDTNINNNAPPSGQTPEWTVGKWSGQESSSGDRTITTGNANSNTNFEWVNWAWDGQGTGNWTWDTTNTDWGWAEAVVDDTASGTATHDDSDFKVGVRYEFTGTDWSVSYDGGYINEEQQVINTDGASGIDLDYMSSSIGEVGISWTNAAGASTGTGTVDIDNTGTSTEESNIGLGFEYAVFGDTPSSESFNITSSNVSGKIDLATSSVGDVNFSDANIDVARGSISGWDDFDHLSGGVLNNVTLTPDAGSTAVVSVVSVVAKNTTFALNSGNSLVLSGGSFTDCGITGTPGVTTSGATQPNIYGMTATVGSWSGSASGGELRVKESVITSSAGVDFSSGSVAYVAESTLTSGGGSTVGNAAPAADIMMTNCTIASASPASFTALGDLTLTGNDFTGTAVVGPSGYINAAQNNFVGSLGVTVASGLRAIISDNLIGSSGATYDGAGEYLMQNNNIAGTGVTIGGVTPPTILNVVGEYNPTTWTATMATDSFVALNGNTLLGAASLTIPASAASSAVLGMTGNVFGAGVTLTNGGAGTVEVGSNGNADPVGATLVPGAAAFAVTAAVAGLTGGE